MNSARSFLSMTSETLFNTPLQDLPYSVVDLETTGTKPGVNQIIEIGIVQIQNREIINTYQTFLNPGEEIPLFISQMTGITNKHVEFAPLLPDIAPKILPMIQNSIFVAHNAAFDYNFLQKNLKLAGFDFASPRICTVQLSRKLIPQLAHHTLDDVAKYFHIEIPNRHRALDDAIATGKSLLNMFDILIKSGKKIFGSLQELTTPTETIKYKQLKNQIDALPFSPGVYLMKSADDQIIYVGKSKCLQKRVRSYFYNSTKTKKLDKLVQSVEKIDYIPTGSELSALLLESKKIKEHLPTFNKMIRNYKAYPFLKISNEPFPRIYSVREIKPDGATYYGPFKSASSLEYTITNLQTAFKIRPCKAKINPNKPNSMKLCLYYELGECPGVCGGKMSQEEYAQNINKVKTFLAGNEQSVLSKIQHKIDEFSEQLEYEKAAELRDNMISLERILAKQQQVTKSIKENNVIIVEEALDKNTKEIFFVRNGIIHTKLTATSKKHTSFNNSLLKDSLSNFRYSYLKKDTSYFIDNNEYSDSSLNPKEYIMYQSQKEQDNLDNWIDMLKNVYQSKETEKAVSKETIDDLMIISTWLMQNTNRTNIYYVNPINIESIAHTLAKHYSL